MSCEQKQDKCGYKVDNSSLILNTFGHNMVKIIGNKK